MAKQFTKFPPDVAKSLRKALYFSNHQIDPEAALKYYKMALDQCAAHHLDAFSDDVVGINIQVASWLEHKINDIRSAIKVLDVVLEKHKKWLETCATTPEKLPWAPVVGKVYGQGESASTMTQEDFQQWLWNARNRVLTNAIQISVKLGELNTHDQILDMDKSHDHLIWGVEQALKESQRRLAEDVGEGPWFSPAEVGGAMECK